MRWTPSVTRASLAAVVFGMAALVGFSLVESSAQARAEQRLNTTADLVQRNLQEGFDDVLDQLSAHAALFEASDVVTEEEFDRFAGSVRGTAGVRGWGVVAVVPAEQLDGFVESVRELNPGYSVFFDTESPVGVHYPILYWQSYQSAVDPRGLDVATTVQGGAVQRAIASRQPEASALAEIRQLGAEGTLVVYPVVHRHEAVSIVVTAPVVIDEFLTAQLPSSLGDVVTVELLMPEEAAGLAGVVREVGVGSQRWLVSIEPVPGSTAMQYAAVVPWVPLSAILVAFAAGLSGFILSKRRDLQQQLDQTLRLNEARDEFLGVIAHGIRTPLTAVVGFSDELHASWPHLDDRDRDEMLRIIHHQSHALADIVADLLVVGRADIGTLYLSRGPVRVLEVLGGVVDTLEPEQRDRVVVSGDDIVADADPARTGQVLRNLLVNALGSGAHQVAVSERRSGSDVWIQLRSDGAELPENFRDVGSGRYEVLPRPGDDMVSAGLGVLVARRLVEAMGGHLTSRRHEGWTIVEISLPAGSTGDAGVGSFWS